MSCIRHIQNRHGVKSTLSKAELVPYVIRVTTIRNDYVIVEGSQLTILQAIQHEKHQIS